MRIYTPKRKGKDALIGLIRGVESNPSIGDLLTVKVSVAEWGKNIYLAFNPSEAEELIEGLQRELGKRGKK